MAWEKTCNHVSVKGQVSRKYKEILQFNLKSYKNRHMCKQSE